MSRKVYLMGEESLVQFFKRPMRYLKENTTRKESVFEKPYLDEEYRKMHFNFPTPSWPSIPGLPQIPPLPDIPGPDPLSSVCAITCYEPNDCDEPIWCHPSIWCGTDMMCNLCVWEVTGAVLSYGPHPFGGSKNSNWGIDVYINTDLVEDGGEALVHVQMKDPCGNLCGEDIEVTCRVCPPEVEMTWDSDVSAQEIGRSDSVTVAIKDGLGPYSWEVDGTGFSMLHPTTSGVQNTLQSDGTVCGPATITVTDFCDDTVTEYVRCTAASDWAIKSDYDDICVLSGPASYYASNYVFEFIDGYQRQIESIIYKGGGSSGGWSCASYPVLCDSKCTDSTCLTAPFIEGLSGSSIDITPNCVDFAVNQIACYCGEINLHYYEWECT